MSSLASNLLVDVAKISPEGLKITLVLFLAFLIGLEREGHIAGDDRPSFGGVRTFPLIGLTGYAMALLAGDQIWAVAAGLLVIGGFLMLSYWSKLTHATTTGMTSEMSALTTYLIGALVSHDQYWIATTLAVASMILLELKSALEGLARRVSPDDVLTFTKFLLLTAVVLPIIPDEPYTRFAINPFRTWLVVVAVSAISYGSYVVQKVTRARGGVLLAAVLGGAYSSTLTTIVLARRASFDPRGWTLSGAILVASGVMYLRLAVLLALFNRDLFQRLGPPFVALAAAAVVGGAAWARRDGASSVSAEPERSPANPLELRAALLFALLFVAMLVAGNLATAYLGRSGVYALATVMGVTDVDPFILSMTQADQARLPLSVTAGAIVIAAVSNNVAKAVYACALAPRATGVKALLLLLLLALAGALPLLRW